MTSLRLAYLRTGQQLTTPWERQAPSPSGTFAAWAVALGSHLQPGSLQTRLSQMWSWPQGGGFSRHLISEELSALQRLAWENGALQQLLKQEERLPEAELKHLGGVGVLRGAWVLILKTPMKDPWMGQLNRAAQAQAHWGQEGPWGKREPRVPKVSPHPVPSPVLDSPLSPENPETWVCK